MGCDTTGRWWSCSLIHEFVLGDGIQDVQVDSRGAIWVSYFDEGVFGNFGWGDGVEPLGADGLVRFDTQGERVWRFDDDEMADCYALNVAAGATWICFYTGFPIVKIAADGSKQHWETDLEGTGPIAIGDRHVVSFGNYSKSWKHGTVLELLSDQRTRVVAEVEVSSPAETPDFVGCRDSKLYVLDSGVWRVGDIGSLGL